MRESTAKLAKAIQKRTLSKAEAVRWFGLSSAPIPSSNQRNELLVKALILMDVDGVLNPTMKKDQDFAEPVLNLSPDRTRLLSSAAGLGELIWATSHGLEQTDGLQAQAGIAGTCSRIPLGTLTPDDMTAPTPKLRRVIRWIDRARIEAGTDTPSIVWIDDLHGADARAWACTAAFPVLLITPNPVQGLTQDHLDQITAWLNQTRPPAHADLQTDG